MFNVVDKILTNSNQLSARFFPLYCCCNGAVWSLHKRKNANRKGKWRRCRTRFWFSRQIFLVTYDRVGTVIAEFWPFDRFIWCSRIFGNNSIHEWRTPWERFQRISKKKRAAASLSARGTRINPFPFIFLFKRWLVGHSIYSHRIRWRTRGG